MCDKETKFALLGIVFQIKFPLKRKGCQVEVSVLIVLLDIWELLLMIVTIGTQ